MKAMMCIPRNQFKQGIRHMPSQSLAEKQSTMKPFTFSTKCCGGIVIFIYDGVSMQLQAHGGNGQAY